MTWDDVRHRIDFNARGFAYQYRWLLVLFAVALLCDAASTTHFMLKWKMGPGTEVHPVVRLAAMMFGPWIGPTVGALFKGVAGVLVAVYMRQWAFVILLGPTLTSLWAAWYNVWGFVYYEPLLLTVTAWM